MSVNDLVLVQGMKDTRATLHDWNRAPWGVLGSWTLLSLAVSCALLAAVLLVATLSTPDSTPIFLPGIHYRAHLSDAASVLYHNSLVLALHVMACVAGFIAGSSLPQSAAQRSGLSRLIHEKAGPLAIGFVVCATTFSLVTQAYVLGGGVSTVAAEMGMSRPLLLVALLPHALPELVALFLPLAAWLMASRKGEWHKLLAATFVTLAISAPVLVVTALVEVYVSPHLLIALAS
ncbi:MAG TPA: stage II sporulation protein M [Thermoleophilaceae bacterium]